MARLSNLAAFGFPAGFSKEPSVPMADPVLRMTHVPTAKSAFESAFMRGSLVVTLSSCHFDTSFLAFLNPD